MKRSLWVRQLALISALALVLAACGDGDDAEDDTGDDVEETDDAEDEGDDEEDAEEDAAEEDDDGEDEDDEAAVDRPDRDDVLDLGYLLPETGDLSTLGVPQIEAVQLAVEDINAAGGVLGSEVTLETGDEAGEGPVAREETARLINAGVDAIVGAAASGMSQEVIDLTHDNEIVQCSASNTSPSFSDQENNAFYFRTVPPDEAVSPIIANEVIGDGYTNVAVLVRADDYGEALGELVVEELEGSVDVAVNDSYNPEDPDFASLVTEVSNAGADAVVVVGFDEAIDLFRQLIEGGVGPDGLYGGDGLFGPHLLEGVGTDIEGLKVIGASGGADFNERLNEAMPEEEAGNVIYGGQAYDCTVVTALAAIAADSADPAEFNDHVADVTSGGTECTSFEECAGLLEDGEDIDYQGASGPLEIERPDPTFGRYAVGEFTADSLEIVGDQDVDLGEL
ncbi:MAG: ABC transporter substrate-binding protein [Actinomycetota bacterium]